MECGYRLRIGSTRQTEQERSTLLYQNAVRYAPSNCNRIFLRRKVKRSTAVTSDERWARTRFTAVHAAVMERRKDLSKIAADQAAFQAQKDTAGGKKTMYAFLWKLEGEAYDQAHPKA